MKVIDERERQKTKTERNKCVTEGIVKVKDERERQKTKTERNKGVTEGIVKCES